MGVFDSVFAVRIYTYICMYTYIYTYIRIHVNILIRIYVYMQYMYAVLDIAVTTVINMIGSNRARREFVYQIKPPSSIP